MEGKCECCGRPLCEIVDLFIDGLKQINQENNESDHKLEHLWVDIGGEG